jgi:hypothetical protein
MPAELIAPPGLSYRNSAAQRDQAFLSTVLVAVVVDGVGAGVAVCAVPALDADDGAAPDGPAALWSAAPAGTLELPWTEAALLAAVLSAPLPANPGRKK